MTGFDQRPPTQTHITLPSAQVTQRFDPTIVRVSASDAGMDCVSISFQTLSDAASFLRKFWIDRGLKEANRFDESDLCSQTHFKGDRSKIEDLSWTNQGYVASIYGNWEPLTDEAKAWLRQNTQLNGSLD